MNDKELITSLFRTEYRKIISVLCRHFGFEHIEIAEDITSDTFAAAAESWTSGIPENPTAWLYQVAKNKAKNHIHRGAIFANKIAPELQQQDTEELQAEIDLSPENISDSQLQIMFAICHPAVSDEAQITLALRLLCGFGIDEIAMAFQTNKELINKRLFRAKEKLRQSDIKMALPAQSEINKRLNTVLTCIYLLFNEGYYSSTQNKTLQKELCLEAMRLCHLLLDNRHTNQPQVNALLALMYFHASRFEARQNSQGEILLYDEQDSSLWHQEFISRGMYFLHCSANGQQISKYHLEAGIAYWHTQKTDSPEKWENILQHYNRLLQIEYSPIAALNRTYALSKTDGKQVAIIEAEKLKLENNHFYFCLLGELYTDIDHTKARTNFIKAYEMAKSTSDKQLIKKKLNALSAD